MSQKARASRGFVVRFQTLFDALAGFVTEGLPWQIVLVSVVVMRGITKEMDMPAITATPFAEEQMDAQAQPLRKGQGMVKRLGLKTRYLPAVWGEFTRAPEQGFQDVHHPVHHFQSCCAIIRSVIRVFVVWSRRSLQAVLPAELDALQNPSP